MKEPDITEYRVCQHYLPAIINGDYSGMEEDDIEKLDKFLEDFDLQEGHFDCDSDEEASFERCEICKLMGDVITLRWVQMK